MVARGRTFFETTPDFAIQLPATGQKFSMLEEDTCVTVPVA